MRLPIFSIGVFSLAFSAAIAGNAKLSPKDLFFEQIDNPTEQISTGVKYRIELLRAGKRSFVDNRTTFKSADMIRFRVVPNLNGYAYVAMVKGSSGKQSVLFPNAKTTNNQVRTGAEYVIPSVGYFEFDKNPGTETIKMIVSRNPIGKAQILEDGSSWITANNDAENAPKVAANSLVAFPGSENSLVDVPGSDEGIDLPENNSKDLFYTSRPSASHATRRVVHHPLHRVTHHAAGPHITPAERPGVILIDMNPTENLGANIPLQHI